MRCMKLCLILLCTIIMAMGVVAQPENLSADFRPGVMPDNAFYFLDTLFDGLQSPEAVANEKAAEVVAMAQENKLQALEKAREKYQKALERRNKEAEKSEESAEEVARQTSLHLEILSEVYEKVPKAARPGIERAMENSAQGREDALDKLKESNPEKGAAVALETLTAILERAPEQAKPGLERAIAAVESQKPAEPGQPSDLPAEQKSPEAVSPEDKGTKGNLRILVSDAPADIADFDYLIVHLSEIRIFSGDENESGFEERKLNASLDLTELVGELSAEVLSTELAPGMYTKIELHINSVDSKVNNETAAVKVPSEKLQMTKPFEIVAGEVTTFVFDINVVKKGKDNEYNLLPVISKSGVVGKDLDEEEVEEVEVTECNEEVACQAGFTCMENKCEEVDMEGAECAEDVDCAEGWVCSAGVCEEQEE